MKIYIEKPTTAIADQFYTKLKDNLAIFSANQITLWTVSDLVGGSNFIEEKKKQLNTADVVLFLVSSDNLAIIDDYKNEDKKFFTVILSSCLWEYSDIIKSKAVMLHEKDDKYNSAADKDIFIVNCLKKLLNLLCVEKV